MRNSLPLCPCVGGGREDGGGGLVGVESPWEVSVTLQYCHTEEGGREGCREKGQPMRLHKATCGKSYVEGPWSLSSMLLLAWRCVVMDYNTHRWWICLKWEIFFDPQGQFAFILAYVSVFPLYLQNTVCTNRENREKVREKHHKRERKHNSRALLNKKICRYK